MKIYNEKEQENGKFEEERNGVKWNKVFKEINRLKTGRCDLRAGSHTAKWPTCEKELKKSLELGLVVHGFKITAFGRQRLAHL